MRESGEGLAWFDLFDCLFDFLLVGLVVWLFGCLDFDVMAGREGVT